MSSRLAWFAVAMTILFTVYGQMAVRMRAMHVSLPSGGPEKVQAVFALLLDPWIASALGAAFIAALFWIAAMTKLPLTTAYPFMSLPFIIVAILAALFLNEPLNAARLAGIGMVVAGLIVIARA
jgi:multidrug transporter EmrE-like cation transporter